MSQIHDDNRLLKALQARYHQIVNLITAMRIKSYRPNNSNPANEIFAKQLRSYINHFPVTEGLDGDHENMEKVTNIRSINKRSTLKPSASRQPAHNNSQPVDTIGEKLMQSTWDHLHACIRYTRAGNRESAKLHASIMDSALKEAAHFLDDTIYNEFVLNLEKELRNLTWSSEQNSVKLDSTNNIH